MIAILTGGPGLGVHVPGVLLNRRLGEHGTQSQVFLAEAFWQRERRDRIAASREAYQRDFRMARLGQRVFRDLSDAFDREAVESVMARWRDGRVRRLVVLSGLWLPIVDRYLERFGEIPVDVCHVDSVPSPSFARGIGSPARHRAVWLFDSANTAIPWTIRATTRPPVPWPERERRILAHGGGWSMGTYQERAGELRSGGMDLDLVVRAVDEAPGLGPGSRRFMMDPRWNPWQDDGFPPFGEVVTGTPPVYTRTEHCHRSLELARRALAIMSKPGGGTMLDAFTSATPIIFLDCFGEHERHNAELWIRLGVGITFEGWRESDFSAEPLARMHHRLLELRDRPRDYALALASESP